MNEGAQRESAVVMRHIYVVCRVDSYMVEAITTGADVERFVKLKEALPSMEAAEAEVTRLNQLNGDKDCSYFWQSVRYYPDGRGDVQSG
jgi:hypothetical protein